METTIRNRGTLPHNSITARTFLLWTLLLVLCDFENHLATSALQSPSVNLSKSTSEMTIEVGEMKRFWLRSKVELVEEATVNLFSDHPSRVTIEPQVSRVWKNVKWVGCQGYIDFYMCYDVVESVGSWGHWLWDTARKTNVMCSVKTCHMSQKVKLQNKGN